MVSPEFLGTLEYIGSKKYFNYLLEKPRKIKITSTSDFNKYKNPDDKIKNIFIHILNSWGMVKYIKSNYDINTIKVAFIIWEWELDELGIIGYYFANNKNDSSSSKFFPILGKTQLLSKIVFLKKRIP